MPRFGAASGWVSSSSPSRTPDPVRYAGRTTACRVTACRVTAGRVTAGRVTA
ncbi:MAG TPA: hypothetical protein VES42_14100 [Pilimelia sp.]|nr:hypothetical protein [Pilimelia sp.]